MAFGVYVHIPYCLQRCIYCDFATYQTSQILPPSEYIERVKKEIRVKGPAVGPRPLKTLYFGGGTPSLLEPELLGAVVQELKDSGFSLEAGAEVTLEINPATLNPDKLSALMEVGFNRFSVGAQSFSDDLLKKANRIHSAQDTKDTLRLLKESASNFSLDILFALPTQTLDDLRRDLDEALRWSPPHVSPYCLTVPEGHPFAKGRAPDEEQVSMFELIEKTLNAGGLDLYEISNFAKPGLESRHNLLYWNDEEYWGVGLSSHSYLHRFKWGCRFWNPRNIDEYTSYIDALKKWSLEHMEENRHERLELRQSLTDFFHTSLRKTSGLDYMSFAGKYRAKPHDVASNAIKSMQNQGLISDSGQALKLTKEGRLVSNRVFEEFTFMSNPPINV